MTVLLDVHVLCWDCGHMRDSSPGSFLEGGNVYSFSERTAACLSDGLTLLTYFTLSLTPSFSSPVKPSRSSLAQRLPFCRYFGSTRLLFEWPGETLLSLPHPLIFALTPYKASLHVGLNHLDPSQLLLCCKGHTPLGELNENTEVPIPIPG